jgi:two-component system alkaline phosphatase synthesis response regulator PhoP
MRYKILLVDDEKDIIEFLSYNLKLENFEVIVAYDGEEALKKMEELPSLVILDVMMPKLNGYEVCKKIKQNINYKDIPVIFLTAKATEIDEIQGLELGANDFIPKPISPNKLIARVKSNLRKLESHSVPTSLKILNVGPLRIDRVKYVIYIDSVETIFPKKEFELLFYLALHPGKVFSREILLKDVWGSDVYVVDRTIDVHIRKIREKLDKYEDLIETIKGVGYRFKEI